MEQSRKDVLKQTGIVAIGQAIENETGERVKKMNNRINKYTAKYHK